MVQPEPNSAPRAGLVVIPESPVEIPLYENAPKSSDSARSAFSPSFDCSRGTTSIEKLICRDQSLASMDSAMATAYEETLQRAPADTKEAVRREQREWLSRYARACNAVSSENDQKKCVADHLSGRTLDLKSR
jgi:uncharacterized protein YecT (DUF1311 family)